MTMILYIDKENIKSFVETRQQDDLNFSKYLLFMKEELYLNFNFNKEELEGLGEDVSHIIYRQLIGGENEDQTGGYEFCNCPDNNLVKNRRVKEIENLAKRDRMASYLLNDESFCNKLKQKNCLIVGHVGEETDILKLLREIGAGMKEQVTMIKSWVKHCPNTPVTDIIICDNYLFQRQEGV